MNIRQKNKKLKQQLEKEKENSEKQKKILLSLKKYTIVENVTYEFLRQQKTDIFIKNEIAKKFISVIYNNANFEKEDCRQQNLYKYKSTAIMLDPKAFELLDAAGIIFRDNKKGE